MRTLPHGAPPEESQSAPVVGVPLNGDELYNTRAPLPLRHSEATVRTLPHGAPPEESQSATVVGVPLNGGEHYSGDRHAQFRLCHAHVSINGSTKSLPLEIPQAMVHRFVRDSWLRDDAMVAGAPLSQMRFAVVTISPGVCRLCRRHVSSSLRSGRMTSITCFPGHAAIIT